MEAMKVPWRVNLELPTSPPSVSVPACFISRGSRAGLLMFENVEARTSGAQD